MSAAPVLPVGPVPGVWRLEVCGITFTATAEMRRSSAGRPSVLVKIQMTAALVYVPGSVENQLCDDVVACVGKVPVWVKRWYWVRFRCCRNDYRFGQTPARISEETQRGLELASRARPGWRYGAA